jgi:transcriptional regulator with XRE-family HTH domain
MTKKGYLTPQEYKAIRESLGFTQEEAADFHRVQNVRTIKRWENGSSYVSALACNKITELLTRINWAIKEALKVYQDFIDAHPNDELEVALIVYPEDCYKKFAVGFEDLPNNVHRAMVKRLYLALREMNIDAGIVLFNPQDYFTFLAVNNLTDNQASRGAWATDYRARLLLA